MIKHIVLWELEDKTQADANAAKMKEQLEALVGQAPGLLSAHVSRSFAGYDVALIAELESREALEAYQKNAYHVEKVKPYIHAVRSGSATVDYEY